MNVGEVPRYLGRTSLLHLPFELAVITTTNTTCIETHPARLPQTFTPSLFDRKDSDSLHPPSLAQLPRCSLWP